MAKSKPRKVKVRFCFALGSQPLLYHFSEPSHCWLPRPSAPWQVQSPVNVCMGGWWVAVGDGAQRSMVDIEIWRWNAGNVWKRFTTEIVLTF